MRYRSTTLLTAVLCLFSAAARSETGAAKARIAVLDFDYGTVQTNAAAIFGNHVDLGRGISDLLVERLSSSGAWTVLERRAIDRILAEQNFSNSDRANAATAAKMAKLLGADAVVVGAITQFGRDDKDSSIDAGVLGGYTKKLGLGKFGRRQSKAVVTVTARLVDTSTAEVIASETSQGEAVRSGLHLSGASNAKIAAAAGLIDLRNADFANTIVGEATSKAVEGLASRLSGSTGRLASKAVVVQGLIADVTDGQVVLNIGTSAGVRPGLRLDVVRASREIRDPATGNVLRRVETPVGQVEVVDADERSAIAKVTGQAPVQLGDGVRTSR